MMQPRRALSLVALAGAFALTGCATEGRQMRASDERLMRADPSRVIAAELAFARAAQEKGQWTAFADFAANDAAMFVPEPVNARQWLRGRANPAQAVRWQPHQVWSSCDGTLAVTKGAWQKADGSFGYFTTVWQRQSRGEYRWVMDQGDTLTQPLEAPEMIGSASAACGSQPTPPAELLTSPQDKLNAGAARDGTLRWHVATRPDGSRTVSASYWDGTGWQEAIREQVSAG